MIYITLESFLNSRPKVFKIKSFTTKEGKFSIYDIDKLENVRDRMNIFTVFESEDGWMVRNAFVPSHLQRSGIATDFYIEMNRQSLYHTGRPLRSTQPRILDSGEVVHELSNDGIALWNNFVAKGLAVKHSEKDYKFK